MRVLILGGAGMLGHRLWQVFRERFETYVTVRKPVYVYRRFGIFDEKRMIGGLDVQNMDIVIQAFQGVRPDVVINAVGIIKQLKEAQDPTVSIAINSLLPHRLANLCSACGARFIHISTDCVFSGRKGSYTEEDVSDAEDLYGRTKYLGEVGTEGAITVRTSIIGRELETTSGLVEWFLSQEGKKVQGFTRALYTGFTALALADVLMDVMVNQVDLSGVWQISSEPIAKYDLLTLIRDEYKLHIDIEPYDEFVCDRRLDSTKYRNTTGFVPPPWPDMIAAMQRDPTPYNQWRNR